MSIPASNIVQVIPGVVDAGGSSLQINGLLLTKNTDVPAGKVLTFASSDDVISYFGSTSEEGQNAAYYFKGFENSTKKPESLFIVRHNVSDCPAYLRGASKPCTVAELKALDSATLVISIDGSELSLTIDFTTVTTFSDAADLVQAAIRAVTSKSETVAYSSLFKAFTVTTSVPGENGTVSYASGTAAELLGWTEDQGGVISEGLNARTLTDTLAFVRTVTENWVTFTTTWEATDDEILEMRQWADNFGTRFWAVNWVAKKAVYLDSTSTGHIAATLKDLDLGSGNLVIDSLKYALFEMGAAASVDYTAKTPARGKITYMFKSQDGLAFNVDKESDADALESWYISFYGNWATANDTFKFFAHANCTGKYSFIDTAIDAIWLNNEIQLALLTLMTSALSVPYNEEGYARVRATLQGQDSPIYCALQNGVIRAGVTLNSTQRDQVNLEAGLEIAPTIERVGYYLQVLAPTAQVRQQRGTPSVSLWYTDGGAIHKLVMTSKVIK